ncbi:MAG: PAS domain S-box protein, partial [Chloroflexota bacterium]|nr:PAS domain S-box protein [Chloroflexota bacterium]
MPIPIRVLILDHRPSDAELMLHELRQSGFEPDWQRVDTEADYLAQLQRDFDVILADYSLPQLDWVCALNLLREHSLDIPFILVTDGINEKVTVECLKQGAANCLPKDRLERLGQAVTDVLQEKKPRDEERGAKAALQANEKLFQSLIENVSDIVMLTDGERTISYASPSVKRVLGHEPEDIVGRKTSDFVHPDDVSGFISTFTSPAQRPGFVSLPEVRIRHRDGSWRVFEGVANNRLDDPAVAGIVINCRDITERKRMEETIRKERDFISAVLDTTSALVVVLDREGRIARFNRAYEQTSGYSFEEIKGKYLWDMLLSPQVAESVKVMIDHIETDLFPSEYETSWVTKDGDRRLITWSNAVLYDDEGRAEYGIGVGIDITDRKHAEEVLQRQLEELIVLHTVATAAAEATDEDTLIEHATQAMDKMLDADRFGVMLLDRVVGGLRIHPSYRGQAERVGWGEQMIIPLGHHIVGQVAADGCPRCVSAVLPNTTCLRRHDPPYPDSGIYSQLCVPLKGSEGLIGVLNTESERRDAFSETDERLLTTFAGQLATAIEKVRLMEMLKQRVSDRTRELSALYDVTALANESLEVDEMLKRLLEYVLAAMGCNVGTVHLFFVLWYSVYWLYV